MKFRYRNGKYEAVEINKIVDTDDDLFTLMERHGYVSEDDEDVDLLAEVDDENSLIDLLNQC